MRGRRVTAAWPLPPGDRLPSGAALRAHGVGGGLEALRRGRPRQEGQAVRGRAHAEQAHLHRGRLCKLEGQAE